MKAAFLFATLLLATSCSMAPVATLEKQFADPPDAARPGVYWYFMDGNLSGEEMKADLESMKDAGIGNLVFLEVNVGVPRGPVEFMSDEWQALFAEAVREAERLGIDITLGAGPGWTGSGGPWVKPEQAMQHLVFSETHVQGPARIDTVLPLPPQRFSLFHQMPSDFYRDVVTYTFPRCEPAIPDVGEKALYERSPYTSMQGVKACLPAPADYPDPDNHNVICIDEIADLTRSLEPDGRLKWNAPAGAWTILRMGSRFTGAGTRPAPEPGLGFECDKFNAAALDAHFDNYYGKLLQRIGPRAARHGWTTVHMDSWEMGAQNWTARFIDEFSTRRGYDPRPHLIAYSGRAVSSLEVSERFLWDVRVTAQELVLDNHARHLKKLGRQHGFELSIEPYDMNPTADLDLGAVADVPMAEFWSVGYGFDSSFSCIEASSVAHTMGRPIVSAEAFTAGGSEGWRQYPWSMKNQGDWAFCMGINRFVYHTFAHKPLGSEYRPGMTMGPYGVHWDRGQTWWPMVRDYHRYVSRCSHLLRQGVSVADILYVTPEGAPHVFRPPASALEGQGPLADKKGYAFDGCSPNILMDRAEVVRGRIAFPGGTSYRLMVLAQSQTMTPEFLEKIRGMVASGATVVGSPPRKSPSLAGFPDCDARVRRIAKEVWGTHEAPAEVVRRDFGRGAVYWGGPLQVAAGERRAPMLSASSWVWFPEGSPQREAPPETVYFRRQFHLDEGNMPASARAAITADNAFTLWINGEKVTEGNNFNVVRECTITPFLRPGANALAVAATNQGDAPNPAGLIAAAEMVHADGSIKTIRSDAQWQVSRNAPPGWLTKTGAPSDWQPAAVLGEHGMSPWRLSAPIPPLYPGHKETAELLGKLGVPKDFSATGPVRYTHRRLEDRDIYFVSNRSDEPVRSDCTFRMGGAFRPELWDPVRGARRRLPEFRSEGGVTSIPLEFAPRESFFVVFPHSPGSAESATPGNGNFPALVQAAALEGPWSVSFDTEWGGPGTVAFQNLQDWTQRDERGIRHYSGIATYRKQFECPAEAVGRRRVFLDVGTVHDMARVRLNGKHLGVIWCAPWRLEISEAVRPRNNRLEILVANRWPNRLLGDRQPPDADVRTVQWPNGFLGGGEYKAGRYTFATAPGYGELLPSGLLGPVRIMVPED